MKWLKGFYDLASITLKFLSKNRWYARKNTFNKSWRAMLLAMWENEKGKVKGAVKSVFKSCNLLW